MADYIKFWVRMIQTAFSGPAKYLAWLASLAVLIVIGFGAYLHQWDNGLIVTNMSDQVSWGAYIANFTFLVGVAAAAVLLVFPSYVLKNEDFKEIVIFGEFLAVSAIMMCLLFVMVDMGRPDRFMHILPFIGRMNLPQSILAWDVIVLNGYLLLNLHIPGYVLWKKYCGERPKRRYYLPWVYLSIFWAISIHTVTAFLYGGLGSRAYWNTSILPIRFLISAFAGGPALLLIIFGLITHFSDFKVKKTVTNTLKIILAVTLPINFFLFGSEVFTELYTDSTHAVPMKYLLFGLHGHAMISPYIWGAIFSSILGIIVFCTPRLRNNPKIMYPTAFLVFVGVWVEKGMGLVIPGFIPTPLGDLVEYIPSFTEFLVSLGIWAFGAFVFTVSAKVLIAISLGRLKKAQ